MYPKTEAEMSELHDKVARGPTGAFIDGVLARVHDRPRVPPEVYDDDERAEWLAGYDA